MSAEEEKPELIKRPLLKQVLGGRITLKIEAETIR
jgi:hypothetical protein